ncbi:transcriptional regulator, LysR family [Variovorax paradoxus EPS]|uniref:Transcriptional regulator, LysR family n=1 Tax=Variovorax paradoxus (strain EPS) TaxID=595537 RepID=E6VAN6_VARPE|nr:transcriptional regulator, LysR family [Variovorax paradoxus EPS]
MNERHLFHFGLKLGAIFMKSAHSLDFASIAVLRSFATVVERGGFSPAAKQLGLAPSTMSKHIRALETGLRVALIHRTTRTFDITPSGQRFYERCKGILREIDQASLLAEPATVLKGELRVVASPSFTASVLLPGLPAFMTSHPELMIDLRVGSAQVDLIREGVDVWITLEPAQRNKAPSIKLARNNCVVCASPAYLERHGIPESPGDLKRHAGLLGYGSPYAEEWPFLVGRQVKRYPIRKAFASDNGDALRSCCLEGLGLGGFYAFHVAADLEAGRLVEVLSSYRANPGGVHAIVPHRHYMSPGARAFIEFVRSLCVPSEKLRPSQPRSGPISGRSSRT